MTANNYTDLREALKKTFVARNITAIVLKGDLRDNQPCNYEIPFDLFADFITQRETAARIDEHKQLLEITKMSINPKSLNLTAASFMLNVNDFQKYRLDELEAELKTLKPDKE
jgi:hypothetical protein